MATRVLKHVQSTVLSAVNAATAWPTTTMASGAISSPFHCSRLSEFLRPGSSLARHPPSTWASCRSSSWLPCSARRRLVQACCLCRWHSPVSAGPAPPHPRLTRTESSLAALSAVGTGLLLGAALGVIIPECVPVRYLVASLCLLCRA